MPRRAATNGREGSGGKPGGEGWLARPSARSNLSLHALGRGRVLKLRHASQFDVSIVRTLPHRKSPRCKDASPYLLEAAIFAESLGNSAWLAERTATLWK